MSITELVQVPAADLIIDKNVRRSVDVDKSFISSIRNHGILQPPSGGRTTPARSTSPWASAARSPRRRSASSSCPLSS